MAALVLAFLCCCAAHATVRAQGGTEHLIAEVQGRVEVKRAGWHNFVRAAVGMLVKNGDLLQLAERASAKVTCADLSVRNVSERSYRVRCGSNSPVMRFKGARYSRLRTGNAIATFPVLISPRMTKLLDPRPTLRWTPMNGATSYRVSIMRGSVEHWAQEVTGVTELKYPEGAPPLVPGVTYKAVISVGLRNTGEEGAPNLGFAVLSQEQARGVREAENKIRELRLSETATKLLIANLYATWGVNQENLRDDTWALSAEAIELLEGASPEAAVLRLLGDLYLSLGLADLAEARHLRALKAAEAAGDTQGEALAQFALGRIYTVRLNSDEAARRFQAARELFQSFGDAVSAEKAASELAELQK
jgi:hypothetical protein